MHHVPLPPLTLGCSLLTTHYLLPTTYHGCKVDKVCATDGAHGSKASKYIILDQPSSPHRGEEVIVVDEPVAGRQPTVAADEALAAAAACAQAHAHTHQGTPQQQGVVRQAEHAVSLGEGAA
eukprot:scaffold78515_cov38-Phaeocystis_antarctica.AAC.1